MLKYLGIFIALSGLVGLVSMLAFGHAGVWKDQYLYGTLMGQMGVGLGMYYLGRKAELMPRSAKSMRRLGWGLFVFCGLVGVYIWESGIGTNI